MFLILASCGTSVNQNVPLDSNDNKDSYPEPSALTDPEVPYPVDNDTREEIRPTIVPEGYPPQINVEETFHDPRFLIELPLLGGETTVTGKSPKDLSLAIVDITFGGNILGNGKSNSNGEFSIAVTPLPAGHRIGVAVAELKPGQTFNEMAIEYYPHRGEGFMNVPNIGLFFDTAMVDQ